MVRRQFEEDGDDDDDDDDHETTRLLVDGGDHHHHHRHHARKRHRSLYGAATSVENDDDDDDDDELSAESSSSSPSSALSRLMRVVGPGIMVCLADTDGPCLLTAAQSGARYRYSLVLCQLVLIPVLYAAQELTVRLAACTGSGLTALIRKHFGAGWAWFAVTLHVAMCWIGQASEFGSVGGLFRDTFGVDTRATNTVQFAALCGVVASGGRGFRFTERIGLAVGSLQLVFLVLVFYARADPREILRGLGEFHWTDAKFEVLVAGNVGAVIMPWMLYYQQSAVCERKLRVRDLPYERADTLVGAVLAQSVMTAMLVAAASLRYYGPNDPRSAVDFGDVVRAYAQAITGRVRGEIADLQPLPDDWATLSVADQTTILETYEAEISASWYDPVSYEIARWVTVLGVTGACTVASMVLTITSVWSVAEILDLERDLFRPYRERPLQYWLQYGGLVVAYVFSVATDISRPWFAVLTQTVNGLLILPVAAFLWLLASSPEVLPKEEHRLRGWYKWTLAVVFSVICAYCFYGMVQEIRNPI